MIEASNDMPSALLVATSAPLATGTDPKLFVSPLSDQLKRLLVEMAFHGSQGGRV